MRLPIPEIRVGDPAQCGGLTVFPLFHDGGDTLDYLVSAEALARGSVAIREVSEAGEVPSLLVANNGDLPVLFLEGEELRGAKQNRILNMTVLLGGRTQTRIPVTCVEQGRWGGGTQQLVPGSSAPPSLRHVLKGSIWESLRINRGHRANQWAVWMEVTRKHRALGIRSRTGNMSDGLESRRPQVDDLRTRLPYVRGATGIAVALGDEVVSLDILEKPTICEKLWGRLMQGVAMDALEIIEARGQPTTKHVGIQVYMMALNWQKVAAVGLGEEYRARGDDGTMATALVLNGTLVHGSVSKPFSRCRKPNNGWSIGG